MVNGLEERGRRVVIEEERRGGGCLKYVDDRTPLLQPKSDTSSAGSPATFGPLPTPDGMHRISLSHD